MTEVDSHTRLAIGDLLLDVDAGSLTREGIVLPLPPRTFELLLELAHRYPDHVRRRDLIASVWPDEIVSDETLSQRVLLLRRALSDDSAHPRYVASDRGWGYRLVAPVGVLGPAPVPSPRPPSWLPRLRPWAWSAAGAACAVVALGLLWPETLARARRGPLPPSVIELAPVRTPTGDLAAGFVAERLVARLESGLRAHPSLHVRRAVADEGAGGRPTSVESSADGRIEATLSGRDASIVLTLVLRDARSLRVLWQRRVTGSVYELFDAEDELADAALAAARQAFHVPPAEAVIARADTEAWRLCLRGEWLTRSAQPPSVRSALIVYKQALERDPSSGAAHAGLVLAYATLAVMSTLPTAEAEAPAREAARQAGRFAPAEPRTWLAEGLVRLVFDADLARAEPHLRRAVEAGERDPVAMAFYGLYLQASGRADDSVPLLREAEDLDPFSAPLPYLLGRAHHLSGRCAAALEAYAQALSLDPYFRPALFASAECHSDLGHDRAALHALRGDLGLAGADARALALLDLPRGRVSLWAALCESDALRPREPVHVAHACMRGRRKDRALEWLEKAARERSPALLTILHDPVLDPIRGDGRFREMLVKSGLRPPQA